MKYRKKPVVIDAFQWLGEPTDAGTIISAQSPEGSTWMLRIETLEGPMLANLGDWIITGIEGERYPCKPDIFAATYEPEHVVPAQPVEELREAICRAIYEGYVDRLGLGETPDWDEYPEHMKAVVRVQADRVIRAMRGLPAARTQEPMSGGNGNAGDSILARIQETQRCEHDREAAHWVVKQSMLKITPGDVWCPGPQAQETQT